ncbi:MAG: enoyl-CoA hydratase/isomerase family protein [Dehalococcoidia bacterium]|nr:MAG: enoyl-CoA hydratase/isomerase family protein [Dehalococcoidia bacterium]
MSKVETERKGRFFVVTINRLEVRNAVDGETAGLLYEAIEAFRRDENLDVLILTGAGDVAFCSGADLKDLAGLVSRPKAEEYGPMGISRITNLHKPSIAAINGYCLAGGLELACWCDFRIASRNASFGVLNRRWGVPLLDGGTQRLLRIVGLGNALYLIETGVQIDAGYALRIGLVQEVVPEGQALPRALELAEVISSYPQTSLRNDRRAALEGLSLPLAEGLRLEQQLHQDSLADPAMLDAVQRYADGQRPPPPRPPA